MRRMPLLALIVVAGLQLPLAAAAAKRPIVLEDLARLREVSDPQRSPEGACLAYTVPSIDVDKDCNVPVVGVEQMYQALRSLRLDTQLVVYPDQFHSLTVPSYQRDRLQRYLAWWGKYLQPGSSTPPAELPE